MPFRKRNREINIVGISALDVFCNTVGVLAFMLLLFVIITIDLVISSRPIPKIPYVKLKILTDPNLPDAIVGELYDLALSASGGIAPLRWKVDESLLPINIQFNRDEGRLYGLPEHARKYTIYVDVEDSAPKSEMQVATATLRLNILSASKAATKLHPIWKWILWLGVLFIIFVHQAFLFFLARRQSSEIQEVLRIRNVCMIIEPDGKQGLSGNPPSVKDAQNDMTEINKHDRRLKFISWGVLALLLAVYIGWVLTMM